MEKYKIGIKVQVKNRKRVHPRFRNSTGKVTGFSVKFIEIFLDRERFHLVIPRTYLKII